MSVTALTERVFRVRQPKSALDKAALRGVSSVDHTSAAREYVQECARTGP
jgi:hypothetical protein